ncbi:nucleotidyltransferase domain-containing protein [Thermofilum pendens]|uniref:DNA polymerase, beta domain protein region n=1 Tax=Thermofilum pendens (strain DSM 2475 / Hrk 5) TaxID=368408 RepID=A1S0V4_THEPD|nr:nucleotidyltransferase domain-containing protein [Thermofilum pendens]ABL79084.1 DNA polymerase, beta domain protein region [Thermofilum pendens Hrk 5]
MSSWVKRHFEHLRKWREYAEAIAKAAMDVVPGARVYVIGGVAEDRVTALSDIDILVVVPGGARKGLYADVLERAIDAYGLPWDAPVELHIVSENEAKEYLRRARRAVHVTPGGLEVDNRSKA